jgi:hypothetical protein
MPFHSPRRLALRPCLWVLCRLLTIDGALMGSVGDAADLKVIGAIAAHTWGEYLHAGKEFAPEGSDLQAMLIELEVRLSRFDAVGPSGGLNTFGITSAGPCGALGGRPELSRLRVLEWRRARRAAQGQGTGAWDLDRPGHCGSLGAVRRSKPSLGI